MLAKILTCINIGEVYLDKRNIRGQESVANGDAGMGKGRWIDNDKPGLVGSCLLNAPDNITFDILLEGFELNIMLPGHLRQRLIDRCQRIRSVNFGFPTTQQVQIRSMYDQYFCH